MEESDLDFVAGMLGDPEVMRHYPKVLDREEARAWIERQRGRYARDGSGLWLVVDRENGSSLGQVGLIRQEVEGVMELEIGYLVHRPFWRRGYAIEAASGVRDWARKTLGLRRVVSLIRPENFPSQAVARRLGMAPERRVVFREREHVLFSLSF